jgi:hypothetical protein
VTLGSRRIRGSLRRVEDQRHPARRAEALGRGVPARADTADQWGLSGGQGQSSTSSATSETWPSTMR